MLYKFNSYYKILMYICCLCYISLLYLIMYRMLILLVCLYVIDFVYELEFNIIIFYLDLF